MVAGYTLIFQRHTTSDIQEPGTPRQPPTCRKESRRPLVVASAASNELKKKIVAMQVK
jgi:hypothetical protein